MKKRERDDGAVNAWKKKKHSVNKAFWHNINLLKT